MSVEKKSRAQSKSTFAAQYEEKLSKQAEVVDSPEEYRKKRLNAEGMSEAPAKLHTQSDPVLGVPVEPVPYSGPVESSIQRKSLVARYDMALQELSPIGVSILKLLYFGEHHSCQLSILLITKKLGLDRQQVRRMIFRLDKLNLIYFTGFPLNKIHAINVGLIPSVRTFLLENNI